MKYKELKKQIESEKIKYQFLLEDSKFTQQKLNMANNTVAKLIENNSINLKVIDELEDEIKHLKYMIKEMRGW